MYCWVRSKFDNVVEQYLKSSESCRRDRVYRTELARGDRLCEVRINVFLRQRSVGKIFLHQIVVRLRYDLDQPFAGALKNVTARLGHRYLLRFTVRVKLVGLLMDDINDSLEICLCPY